jgi:hypothetical protein
MAAVSNPVTAVAAESSANVAAHLNPGLNEPQSDHVAASGAPEEVAEARTNAKADPSASSKSNDVHAQTGTPTPELRAKGRHGRMARREKLRRDHQIDLFEVPPRGGKNPATDASTNGQDVEQSSPSGGEPALPSTASGPQESAEPDIALVKQGAAQPPAPARRPSTPPVNPAQFRKTVNEILPLLTDQDPGAKDCLKANRPTFRSAFSPEAFAEFEQFVKASDFEAALEHLRRAAKKQGISL